MSDHSNGNSYTNGCSASTTIPSSNSVRFIPCTQSSSTADPHSCSTEALETHTVDSSCNDRLVNVVTNDSCYSSSYTSNPDTNMQNSVQSHYSSELGLINCTHPQRSPGENVIVSSSSSTFRIKCEAENESSSPDQSASVSSITPSRHSLTIYKTNSRPYSIRKCETFEEQEMIDDHLVDNSIPVRIHDPIISSSGGVGSSSSGSFPVSHSQYTARPPLNQCTNPQNNLLTSLRQAQLREFNNNNNNSNNRHTNMRQDSTISLINNKNYQSNNYMLDTSNRLAASFDPSEHLLTTSDVNCFYHPNLPTSDLMSSKRFSTNGHIFGAAAAAAGLSITEQQQTDTKSLNRISPQQLKLNRYSFPYDTYDPIKAAAAAAAAVAATTTTPSGFKELTNPDKHTSPNRLKTILDNSNLYDRFVLMNGSSVLSTPISSASCQNDDMAVNLVTDGAGAGMESKSGAHEVIQLPGFNSPESAFYQYQNRMEGQKCQVCGELAAGFHHGAYVCEACKKFFMRHSMTDTKPTNVCPTGGNCPVAKGSRGKCQICRYRKCLLVGMKMKDPESQSEIDISNIPCRVCGGRSSGFHFGALTCEGCKGFFRRTEGSANSLVCVGGQNACTITPRSRNACKSCRFRRCLSAGMSKKGSRIGRQPNAVKFHCAIEIKQLQSARSTVTGCGGGGNGGGGGGGSTSSTNDALSPGLVGNNNNNINYGLIGSGTVIGGGGAGSGGSANSTFGIDYPNNQSITNLNTFNSNNNNNDNHHLIDHMYTFANLNRNGSGGGGGGCVNVDMFDPSDSPTGRSIIQLTSFANDTTHPQIPSTSSALKTTSTDYKQQQQQTPNPFPLLFFLPTTTNATSITTTTTNTTTTTTATNSSSSSSTVTSNITDRDDSEDNIINAIKTSAAASTTTSSGGIGHHQQHPSHRHHLIKPSYLTAAAAAAAAVAAQTAIPSTSSSPKLHGLKNSQPQSNHPDTLLMRSYNNSLRDHSLNFHYPTPHHAVPPHPPSLPQHHHHHHQQQQQLQQQQPNEWLEQQQQIASDHQTEFHSHQLLHHHHQQQQQQQQQHQNGGNLFNNTNTCMNKSQDNSQHLVSAFNLSKTLSSNHQQQQQQHPTPPHLHLPHHPSQHQVTDLSGTFLASRLIQSDVDDEPDDERRMITDSGSHPHHQLLQQQQQTPASVVHHPEHRHLQPTQQPHPHGLPSPDTFGGGGAQTAAIRAVAVQSVSSSSSCSSSSSSCESASTSTTSSVDKNTIHVMTPVASSSTSSPTSPLPTATIPAAVATNNVVVVNQPTTDTMISFDDPIFWTNIEDDPMPDISPSNEAILQFMNGMRTATEFLRLPNAYFKSRFRMTFILPEHQDNINQVWSHMMNHFHMHAQQIVQFAKLVPGFSQLGITARSNLVRESMYPVLLLVLSRDYRPDTDEYNYFDFTHEEREVIMRHFPSFRRITEHLLVAGRLSHHLNMDLRELSLACAVEILRNYRILEEPTATTTAELFILAHHSLLNCMTKQSATSNISAQYRWTQLLALRRIVQTMHREHNKILGDLKRARSDLRFPDLFVEMFQLADSASAFFSASAQAVTLAYSTALQSSLSSLQAAKLVVVCSTDANNTTTSPTTINTSSSSTAASSSSSSSTTMGSINIMDNNNNNGTVHNETNIDTNVTITATTTTTTPVNNNISIDTNTIDNDNHNNSNNFISIPDRWDAGHLALAMPTAMAVAVAAAAEAAFRPPTAAAAAPHTITPTADQLQTKLSHDPALMCGAVNIFQNDTTAAQLQQQQQQPISFISKAPNSHYLSSHCPSSSSSLTATTTAAAAAENKAV